jgi:ribonuclease-3
MTDVAAADASAPEPLNAAALKGRKPRPNSKAAALALQERLGYPFKNPALLINALTHVSALKTGKSRAETYQRLEFLGDHVLGLVVSDMLYRTFPKAAEGELSTRLADLVRKESCADVAQALGLQEATRIGSGASPRLRASVAGDICEAVIGAIYLDGGFSAASDFIVRNWTERMNKPVRPLRDPKTILQEWAQGRGLAAPTYREVERSGPDHSPVFRIAVDAPGLESAEGVGRNKRAAEQAAASAMLAREGVESSKKAQL